MPHLRLRLRSDSRCLISLVTPVCPQMPPITASTVLLHPWSLKYLYLKVVATLLRSLTGVAQAREFKRALMLLPAGVTRRRIQVPSRDKGRTIAVDVYERERASEGPRAVHLNFHGCVRRRGPVQEILTSSLDPDS